MAIYLDGPTPESIAAARHAMLEERAAVERAIGRPVSDAGRILKFPAPSRPFIVRCAKCRFESQGQTEGYAIRGMAQHVVRKHMPASGGCE